MLLAALLVGTVSGSALANEMHPSIVLLDANGVPVLTSGAPVSTMETCGACHDTDFIVAHDLHAGATARVAPRSYMLRPFEEAPSEHIPDVESNCFLCHLAAPADAERIAALQGGLESWAATATLVGTGLVERDPDGGWRYVPAAFSEVGDVPPATHGLRSPNADNCGICHGQVHFGSEPLVLDRGLGNCCTETTGQVFSPQRLSSSGVNLEGREVLYRPWDIHAERLLDCTSCHHSLNNPAYYSESDHTRPGHQPFEARKLGIAAYLRQPSHMLAKGRAAQGSQAEHMDDTMRSCSGCHDPLVTHEWLPNREQHLRRLSCEACHIPSVFAPARQVTDWTVLLPDDKPRVEHRGVDGPPGDPASFVRGYRPALLPRAEADGETRLYPYNLISTWSWVSGPERTPVPLDRLRAAFFEGKRYHPAIVAGFDADGDGKPGKSELVIDSEEKQRLVEERLVAVGVADPAIHAVLQPFGLHHGVATKEWVNRDCQSCHAEDSRLSAPFELAGAVAGGVLPALPEGGYVHLAGSLVQDEDGRLFYQPETREAGLYVLGHDSEGIVDYAGLLLILGSLFGVAVHAGLRIRAARLRKQEVQA